jgi:hypothetical protein
MPKGQTGTNNPTEPLEQWDQIVGALQEIAVAIAANAAELRAAQAVDSDATGARTPSPEQARAALNYRLLSQLVGRASTDNVTLAAQRFRDNDLDRILFFGVPDDAVVVSVLAAGAREPELLGFDDEPGPERTVTLDLAQDRDIVRIEVQDGAGLPVRIGPALPRVPEVVVD